MDGPEFSFMDLTNDSIRLILTWPLHTINGEFIKGETECTLLPFLYTNHRLSNIAQQELNLIKGTRENIPLEYYRVFKYALSKHYKDLLLWMLDLRYILPHTRTQMDDDFRFFLGRAALDNGDWQFFHDYFLGWDNTYATKMLFIFLITYIKLNHRYSYPVGVKKLIGTRRLVCKHYGDLFEVAENEELPMDLLQFCLEVYKFKDCIDLWKHEPWSTYKEAIHSKENGYFGTAMEPLLWNMGRTYKSLGLENTLNLFRYKN
jgi:hypothetical protein